MINTVPANVILMRATIVGLMIILILLPSQNAAIPPVKPKVSIDLSPTVMNVTCQAGQNVTVTFNGTVTAQMMTFLRITVGLWSSVDTGWTSTVTPNSMVITDNEPHGFTCDVIVPKGTPTTTAQLTVDANIEGGGTTHAMATINAQGAPPANQTANSQSSQNQSVNPPAQTESSNSIAGLNNPTIVTASGAVLIITIAGIVAFVLIKRRKTTQHQ